MCQRNVERVIGRLVTDEDFRRRFAETPGAALQEMIECGLELTDLELRALASIDAQLVALFADAIDPRIQKINLNGGRS
jgi:hypothetical protein